MAVLVRMVLAKISLTFIDYYYNGIHFFCNAFIDSRRSKISSVVPGFQQAKMPMLFAGGEGKDKGRGSLDGQVEEKGVRISNPFQWRVSVGVRIDVLKKTKNINLSPLRFLPEFVKVASGDQAHIMAA